MICTKLRGSRFTVLYTVPDMLFIAVIALYSVAAHCATAYTPGPATGDENERGLSIDLDNLSRRLQMAEIRPFNIQRRSCRLGIHNHNCALLDLERLKAAEEYLKSGDSPGKRDSQQSDEEDDLLPLEDIGSFEVSQGLDEQKQALVNLRQLLKELKPHTENIQTIKKDCRFRLGGHCLTESLDRAANQYYYLKSPNSPGRRRRNVSTSSQE